MSVSVNLKDFIRDLTPILYLPEFFKEGEEEIITYLLENKDRSKYEISRGLKRSYSNVYKIIRGFLEKELIRVSQVKRGGKNPNIKVEYYSLTDRAISGLLTSPLSKTEGKDKASYEALHYLFRNIQKNYPAFLPEGLRELPASYFVSFYPLLRTSFKRVVIDDLPYCLAQIGAFLSLIKAKIDEKEKTKFLVKNDSIENMVPITEKELEILTKYTTKLIEESEKVIQENLQKIKEKEAELKKLRLSTNFL